MKERVYRALKNASLVSSKAEAQEFLKNHDVYYDNKKVSSVLYVVDLSRGELYVDGRPIRVNTHKIYILMNKPRGYSCMSFDEYKRPFVVTLIKPSVDVPEDQIRTLFPVGRLDIDTEGLLLITNDGAYAHQILDPNHEIEKEYEVVAEGIIMIDKIKELEAGVAIPLEQKGKKSYYRTQPCKIFMGRVTEERTTLRIVIEEGKKRQIRKMFFAIGHRVMSLTRVRIGNLNMPTDLKFGRYKVITQAKAMMALEERPSKKEARKRLYE